jgi:hypothetical protein
LNSTSVSVVRDPLDADLGRRNRLEPRRGHAGAGQAFAQPIGSRLRLDSQRVVGVHPEHQVDAALEVEAESDAFGRRHERPERQTDDDRNGEKSPA